MTTAAMRAKVSKSYLMQRKTQCSSNDARAGVIEAEHMQFGPERGSIGLLVIKKLPRQEIQVETVGCRFPQR